MSKQTVYKQFADKEQLFHHVVEALVNTASDPVYDAVRELQITGDIEVELRNIARRQLELVLEAERLGYDSVWTAEAYGSDAATILAWLAQATTTIKLGSAIFQMPGRSAAMTAMTARPQKPQTFQAQITLLGTRQPASNAAASSAAPKPVTMSKLRPV